MLKKKDRSALDQIEFVSTGCLVPENHLLRAVQASINFDFIYDEVKDLYSETSGRPSIDLVVDKRTVTASKKKFTPLDVMLICKPKV